MEKQPVILYQRKYTREELEEIERDLEESFEDIEEETAESSAAAEDDGDALFAKVKYIPIPKRIKKSVDCKMKLDT